MITQAQMSYFQLHKFKKKFDLEEEFKKFPDYDTLLEQLSQDKEFKKKITLIIDIESVFITPISFSEYIEMKEG